MPINAAIIDKTTGYQNVDDPSVTYRVVKMLLPGIANAAGGGAGQAVTTPIAMPAGFSLPAVYSVIGNASQAANLSFSAKTTSGFNAVLTPLNAGDTLSAGTFDLEITYQK